MLPKPTDKKLKAFLSNIVKQDNGCWYYTKSPDEHGYGRIGVVVDDRQVRASYKTLKAHRCYLEWIEGIEVPDDKIVCHTCHNPPCVNPEHLFIGTRLDNAQIASPKQIAWRESGLGRPKKSKHVCPTHDFLSVY